MYVCTLEEFILVDLDTLLHKVEVKMHGKMQVYIHSQQGLRNVRIALDRGLFNRITIA